MNELNIYLHVNSNHHLSSLFNFPPKLFFNFNSESINLYVHLPDISGQYHLLTRCCFYVAVRISESDRKNAPLRTAHTTDILHSISTVLITALWRDIPFSPKSCLNFSAVTMALSSRYIQRQYLLANKLFWISTLAE